MAKSTDIQNEITRLQAQVESENNAAQNLNTQITNLQNQYNQQLKRVQDLQVQVNNKQNEWKAARDNEAKEMAG